MTNNRQLADAFRAAYEDILDESPLAPDWERATGQVVSLQVKDSSPRIMHVLAGTAAVVVFAVASLGAYVIFMRSADDSPAAVTTLPDTAVTTLPDTAVTTLPDTAVTTLPDTAVTTVPITLDPAASEAAWSRWSLDPTVFGNAAVGDVVNSDGTLVAVGATHDCILGCGASVWLSGNGVEWTRVFTDPNGWSMTAATVGEHGIIAVGVAGRDVGESTATVWTSSDGTSWTRGELPGGFGASDVVSGGPGYVAVGKVVRVEGDTVYDDAAVWTSVDGSVWTRVVDDADLFTNAWITTIVTTPDGLAAFGVALEFFEVDEDDDRWYEFTLGVWTSVDGLTWTKQATGETATRSRSMVLDAVAEGDSILLASESGLWHSTDLIEWQQVTSVAARSVTSTGSSFVTALQNELDGVPILQSDDAVSWIPITEDPSILFTTDQNIEMTSIRIGGPGILAFGMEYTGSGQGTLQLWTQTSD